MSEFFVVGPDQIVAHDLADAIRVNDAKARVAVFRSDREALDALADVRPMAVILHCEPSGFAETVLGQILTENKIPHAFLSAAEWTGAAAMLESPFTEASVAALLAGLAGGRRRGD